jgi:hypothetical protein
MFLLDGYLIACLISLDEAGDECVRMLGFFCLLADTKKMKIKTRFAGLPNTLFDKV